MTFNASTGVYTPATGATTATAGQVIASATWNGINNDYATALTQLGQGTFAPPTSTLTLVNGLNSNITITSTARMIVSGPTGAFSVGGFTGGADGKRIYLFNNIVQTMTIVNEDASSTAGNRIATTTGQNLVLQPFSKSFVTLSYDATLSRWVVESSNAPITSSPPLLNYTVRTVSLSTSTTDLAVSIPLPGGSSNYLIDSIRIANATAAANTATVAVFTGAGGTGTAIVTASTAVTITTSLPGNNNSAQSFTINNAGTESYNGSPIFFRTGAATATAQVDLFVSVRPL